MNIIEPIALLKPYVKNFIAIESDEIMISRRIPDTGVVIAIRYRGDVHYIENDILTPLPPMAITGLRRSARLIKYAPHTANILVQFQESGASAFFKYPINELFGHTLALSDLIARQHAADLEEQINAATNLRSRIEVIQQFLVSKLEVKVPELMVSSALDKIKSSKGNIAMKALADQLYISQDVFEKRFRRIVGSTPKQYANIIRMKNLISQSHLDEKHTIIALEAGYFDQPHFNKNFKMFTGLTPGEFFHAPYFW